MAAHQAAFEQGDSELWYVATGPGETKLLTLEQLDDLFRLEIIDADTRLWQPGMPQWLPLSVVAGLDEPVAKPSAPPPPSARVPRAPTPPPAPVRAAPATIRPVPLPNPPPQRTTMPVSMSSMPPGRPVPVSVSANTWPAAMPSVAPQHNPYPAPESLRPLTFSQPPAARPRSGGGGFGRFLLTLAALGGVGVTLYRNDVLHQAALSAGQEKNYMKLEAALGGPGFGTPRSVASLAANPSFSMPAVELTKAPPASEPAKPTAVAPAPIVEKPAEPVTREAPSNTLASSMAASIGGASKSKPTSAPAPRSAPPARPKAEAPERGLGFKGGNSTYDPLNGKL